MSDMYCDYSGLKYKIKKRNVEYIITSRVRKEGFTNYIDVLGNEHSDLYMKSIKATEVDVIYNEDVNKKNRDKFLDEIYFFLIDNNMDSVLHERYRVSWE